MTSLVFHRTATRVSVILPVFFFLFFYVFFFFFFNDTATTEIYTLSLHDALPISFELCFYGWKEGAGHHFFGPNNATDLWHVKKVNPQSMIHLTEKPVELAVRAIDRKSVV